MSAHFTNIFFFHIYKYELFTNFFLERKKMLKLGKRL